MTPLHGRYTDIGLLVGKVYYIGLEVAFSSIQIGKHFQVLHLSSFTLEQPSVLSQRL
jgi:hypothetical protein